VNGQPTHFEEPPRVCPHCLTNNPRVIEHRLYDPARPGRTQDLDMPRVVLRNWFETVCGTCNPDTAQRRVYVDGVDPDDQRSPF
jgi:hypothetical protein